MRRKISGFTFSVLLVIIVVLLRIPSVVETYAQGATATPIAPGTVIKDNSGIEMVYVPFGTFQMGITLDAFRDLYRNQFNTDPQDSIKSTGEMGVFDTYTATLDSFWIDRYEVPIEQYTKYMSECMMQGSCQRIDLSHAPHLIDNPQKPQVGVPWYDALAFCSLRDARLPSEEEWEYAAAGVNKFAFPWGNNKELDSYSFGDTSPVGSKPRNVSWIGAYDMAGNAAEWVDDRFKPYKAASSWWSKNVDYERERVTRGGSWESNYFSVTTYVRNPERPEASNSDIGFRCARSSKP